MKKYQYIALSLLAAGSLVSCNDYLDKLPDDRAEIKTADQITDLLVSAYPSGNNIVCNEMSTDNVGENGKSYTNTALKDELYRFKDVDVTDNDSPYYVWTYYYNSVATANQALESIAELGDGEELSGQKAEAKIIRAFSMFQLAQTFCMAWNPEKADEYLGLPYPTKPGTGINSSYVRGTLRELYENINKDIEEALPYIDESLYSVPKYHFNQKAAYAFATRFNLYYMNYDKAIEYANKVLGSDPTTVMRDYAGTYINLSGRQDISNQYIKSSDKANLMLVAAYSLASYYLTVAYAPRFQHNSAMASYETYWVSAPWGSGSSSNTLYYSTMLYGTNYAVAFPKMDYIFEYTDKINGTGYVHVVDPVFTGDETLLCRAEAYALKGELQKCVDDMNVWVKTHCKEAEGKVERPTLTIESINEFVEGLDYAPVDPESNRDRSLRKTLHPQGFTVSEGSQENVLQLLLHMRRLETMFQGMRFVDLKRYGIEFAHKITGEESAIFKAGDLRGAIQLPTDVITAGLEANPR